jgi:periplasmic protein CpxP/Spy
MHLSGLSPRTQLAAKVCVYTAQRTGYQIRREMRRKMQRKYLSIAIGLFLSAGLAIAQAPTQNQPDQPTAAQNAQQPLAGENAPPAQGQRPHAPNPARVAHRLGRQLGLTQDQVAQIQPIIANRQQQMASLRSDTTLTQEDRRAKARSIFEGSRNQIEALLTDTQKQQFEQMLANRRAAHQHNSQPQAQ